MEDTILLINEEGEEVEFIIDAQFDFEDNTYIVLCENEDSEDALLFKVMEDENDELIIAEVEDDDEFKRVSDYYFEI